MTQLAEGDLLTVEQVRRLVPLGKSTIYKLVDEGRLPAIRVQTAGSRRGRILIRRADLDAFVENSRDTRPCAPTTVDVDHLLARVRRRT